MDLGLLYPALDSKQVDLIAGNSTDGLIAVTPIFNASYSGLFKVFFDVLERDSLAGVIVGIVAIAEYLSGAGRAVG